MRNMGEYGIQAADSQEKGWVVRGLKSTKECIDWIRENGVNGASYDIVVKKRTVTVKEESKRTLKVD